MHTDFRLGFSWSVAELFSETAKQHQGTFAPEHASSFHWTAPRSASSFPNLPTCVCGGNSPLCVRCKIRMIHASVYKVNTLISRSRHFEIESEAPVGKTPEVKINNNAFGLPTWSCCRDLHYWMLISNIGYVYSSFLLLFLLSELYKKNILFINEFHCI